MDSRSVLDDISTFFGGAADTLASLPLSAAIATKNPSAVEIILKAGARVQFSHIEKVTDFDYKYYTNGVYDDSPEKLKVAEDILKLLIKAAKTSTTKGQELMSEAIRSRHPTIIQNLVNGGITPTRKEFEKYSEETDKLYENSPDIRYSHPEIEMMKDDVEKAGKRSEALKNLSVFGSGHRQGIAGLAPQAFPTYLCLKITNMTGDPENPVTAEESEKYFSKKF